MMHDISKACAKRDVKELEIIIAKYPTGDDTLLQPYSVVQIAHIAKLIELPVDFVTRKLSHMILDKKLHGILDQGAGAVIMYDKNDEDNTLEYAIETLEALEEVVEHLLQRARAN